MYSRWPLVIISLYNGTKQWEKIDAKCGSEYLKERNISGYENQVLGNGENEGSAVSVCV